MRIKKIELLYFSAVIMLLVRNIIQVSTLIDIKSTSMFFDVLLFSAYILLFIKIIYKENIKRLIVYAIIIFLALISYASSKMTDYLSLVLLVIGAKGIDIKKIVKVCFSFYAITLGVHIIAYIITMLVDPAA